MAEATRIPHPEGVALCERWLNDERDCRGRVLIEPQSRFTGEIVDAIGWKSPSDSIVVDWKCSEADARAHLEKPWVRNPEIGAGRWRYIACEPHVVTPEYMPPWMGVLFYDGAWHEAREAQPFQRWNVFAELALVLAANHNLSRAAGKSANDARKSATNTLSAEMAGAVRAFLADSPRCTAKQIRRAVPEVSKRFKSPAALAKALKVTDGVAHVDEYGVAYFWLEEGA